MGDFPTIGVVGGPDFNPRTMSQAAVAAENQALASAKGRRIRCNRGGGSLATAECVAKFRAGQDDPASQPNCSRDLGCSAGRMRAANFKEGDVTKSNYGKCVLCGRKGNRDSAGQCYNVRCKDDRKRPAPVSGDDAPETCGLGADLVAAGQDDPKRDTESVKAYMDELGAMLDTADKTAGQDHIEEPRHMVETEPDHISQPGKMAIDFTQPFSFAGFDFDPIAASPPPGRPTARLSTSGNFHISSAATRTHGLLRFKFLQIIPDRTGQALVLLFWAEASPGARALAAERKSPCAIKASARALARAVPGLVGKTLELQPIGQDGALLAVVGGVAA